MQAALARTNTNYCQLATVMIIVGVRAPPACPGAPMSSNPHCLSLSITSVRKHSNIPLIHHFVVEFIASIQRSR